MRVVSCKSKTWRWSVGLEVGKVPSEIHSHQWKDLSAQGSVGIEKITILL